MTEEMLMKMGVSAEAAEKISRRMADMEESCRLLEEKNEILMAQKEAAAQELLGVKKRAAAEKAVLEAGGRNAKAVLALLELDEMTFEEKTGLAGIDEALEQVKAEAPYLFLERKEKTVGTGFSVSQQKKRESEISRQFKNGLRR